MTGTTDVVSMITAHHAELVSQLDARATAVIDAARAGGPCDQPVGALLTLLDGDIVPHARAEEEVLYAAATGPQVTLLVSGMVFEHETLLSLASRLRSAPSAVECAALAEAVRAVFVGHVRRENELLLPALAADPTVELPALLPRMQERFAAHQAAPL